VVEARNICQLQFDPQDVIQAPGVLSLVAHPLVLGIAASYLRCEPIVAKVFAWWSLPHQEASWEERSRAAQWFHLDADYPVFVKFFLYLTDVGPDDGPFTYVRTTHRRNSDRRDGRYSDEEIEGQYAHEIYEAVGQAGDLVVADTFGIHKGKPPTTGKRLLVQLEYACSRLGNSAPYPLLPRKLRPPCTYQHTFDIFCQEEPA
jgi:hypothetical protein